MAQLAGPISNAIGFNVDLAEAVELAHDLGQPPFGHCGEDILNELMEPFGGVDHNAQALKIVTRLVQSYAEFDGLNLTWETLEASCNHNGPLTGCIPYALAEYNDFHDLEVNTHAGAEAQVASLADDIAYNCHDLHDGLRAQLFDDEEIKNLPIIREACLAVDQQYPHLELHKRRHEILRRVFGDLVSDVILTSRALFEESGVNSVEDIRHYGRPLVAFSEGMQVDLGQIQKFLYSRMYRSPAVMKKREDVKHVVKDLFNLYQSDVGLLPEHWQFIISDLNDQTELARVVSDYIAGMTDRFALREHNQVKSCSRDHLI